MDCISKSVRVMLYGLLEKKIDPTAIRTVFEAVVPDCPDRQSVVKAATAVRGIAERWPVAVYIDEKGESKEYGSPSELYTHLTGKAVSGSVCNEEGTMCKALSLVDNFRLHGFTVQGNGEPPPATPPDASDREVSEAHQSWKAHLNTSGKKFIVIHPKAPQLHKVGEEGEAKTRKKK